MPLTLRTGWTYTEAVNCDARYLKLLKIYDMAHPPDRSPSRNGQAPPTVRTIGGGG